MNTLNTIISVIYYALCGFIVLLIIYNLIKSKKWKEEVIYLVILIPFLLRLLMLK